MEESTNFAQLEENAPASVSSIILSLSSEDEMLNEFEDDDSLACVTNDDVKENICRICTNSITDDSIYIFGPESEEKQLLHKIKQHLPIKLPRKGDQMPDKVCGLCMEKLNLCHSVAELSARSERILRKTLGLQVSHQKKKRKFDQLLATSPQINSELQPKNEEMLSDFEVAASSTSDDVRYPKRRNVLYSQKGMDSTMPEKSDKPRIRNKYISCKTCDLVVCHDQIQKHYLQFHAKALCAICNETFDSELELANHTQEIHTYSCTLCGILFVGKKLLIQHNNSEHRNFKAPLYINRKINNTEKIYCALCNDSFFSNLYMKKHLFELHRKYSCEICLEMFPDFDTQVQHTQQVHQLPCKFCSSVFYSSLKLNRHVKMKHRIKELGYKNQDTVSSPFDIYKCKTCNKGLQSKMFVKRHNYWCHKIYTCDFCLQEFKNSETENQHFEEVHGKHCYFCDLQLDNLELLISHVQAAHSDKNPFSCEHCGELISDRVELHLHRLMHKSGVTQHKCQHCDKEFTTKQTLTNHLKCVHGDHNFACHVCGKKFAFECLLKRHVNIHAINKPYKCLDCGKAFSDFNRLSRHIQTHGPKHPTDKRFSCNICQVSFFKKRNLNNHFKSLHSVVTALYSCAVCHVSFATESAVTDHLTSHTLIELSKVSRPYTKLNKTYTCDICVRVFSTKHAILGHITKHLKSEEEKLDKKKSIKKLSSLSTREIVEKIKQESTTKKMFINGDLVSVPKNEIPFNPSPQAPSTSTTKKQLYRRANKNVKPIRSVSP